MKPIVVYASSHHKNTEKVARVMAAELGGHAVPVSMVRAEDLAGYDLVGFASGVYDRRLDEGVMALIGSFAPRDDQKTFVAYTCGLPLSNYAREAERILRSGPSRYLGRFVCRGYDTSGPFARVGGIAKGHPNGDDLSRARAFAARLLTR